MASGSLTRRVAYNSAIQIAGKAAVIGLGAISIVVITRYLGTAGYGQFTLALTYIQLFGVLADAGIYTIVVRELAKRPEDAGKLVGNALALRLLLAAIVLPAAVLVSLALPYNEHVRIAILIAVLPFVIGLVNTSLLTVFQARLRMDLAMASETLGRAATLAAIGVVVALDLGFFALVATAFVGALASLAVTLNLSRRLVRVRRQVDRASWRPLLMAAIPLGLALALNEIYFRADTLVISLSRSYHEVGLYALAWRVLELAALIPPVALLNSIFPVLAPAVNEDPQRARRTIDASFDVLAAIGLPMAAGGLVLAPGIVRLAGGPGFAGAATSLELLLVAGALIYVNGLFVYALIAKDRQRSVLRVSIVALALNLALNVGLVPTYGIEAAAAATLACEVLILAGFYLLMRRHLRFFPSLGVVPRALAAAAAMDAVLWPLRHGPVLALVALGAAVYGVVLVLLGGVDRDLIARLRG